MTRRIDTVDARGKLKPRPSPYWHKMAKGCHIGFRRLAAGSSGAWLARWYDTATGKQTVTSFGGFDDLPAHQRFDAAVKAASEWFMHLGKGGSLEVITVAQACANYVAAVQASKGTKQADDLRARFERWVNGDKLAKVALPKLTRRQVEVWRRTLETTPVVADPYAKKPTTRERAASTVNRDMSALRAALNRALDDGHVTTDMAWRVALRPFKDADGQRDAYLDRDQRKAMIQHAAADVGEFLQGLATVPLRPGALAALTVASFDRRLGVLTVGKDKAGRDRKIKLAPATAKWFEVRAKDKLPAAPLLSRADGKAWDKDAWKKPVKAAARAAGLGEEITAYAMRHSAITDLVTGGLDLLTVAQLSGTSVAMIERHYGHLRADHAAAAMEKLAL
jgi:site-specific recombinase XerD